MARGNVTYDPSERARAVDDPEIKHVRSGRSGLELDAVKFISGRRYDIIVRIRNILREQLDRDPPRLTCDICGSAVYLVATTEKVFFFRHAVEDGSCPARTRGEWTEEEIRARKYQGARESDAHKRVKALIARSLAADPRLADVRVERVWRSHNDPDAWRKPDVQARLGDLRLAFEAQLTTTFLDVVARRRAFYRREGALLIWVLRRFDPNDRRLTEDDICFPNNSNVLVVDEETTRRSEAERRCVIRCFHREPLLIGSDVAERWQERIVGLDELQFDLVGQKAWWFDFDGALSRLRADAERIRREEDERRRASMETYRTELRHAVFNFWERNGGWDSVDQDDDEQWGRLRDKLLGLGVDVPEYYKLKEFRVVISALLSARLGRPVGFGFTKLVQVAHNLADAHHGVLVAFGWALDAYGTKAILDAEDGSGAWKRKRRTVRAAIKANSDYSPSLDWSDAIAFLFPEIGSKLRTANAWYLAQKNHTLARADGSASQSAGVPSGAARE